MEKRRVYAWIDYNVPYYQTSFANHPELMHGMRELVPERYDETLTDVVTRRCIECHSKSNHDPGWWNWSSHSNAIPRKFYLRWEEPELNNFMLAPLAKSAGGTEACGKAVFKDKNDPDYQVLLKAFGPIHQRVAEIPRMDMSEAKEVRGKLHSGLYECQERP